MDSDSASLVEPGLVDIYRPKLAFSTHFPILLKILPFFFIIKHGFNYHSYCFIFCTYSFLFVSIGLSILRFLSFQLDLDYHTR